MSIGSPTEKRGTNPQLPPIQPDEPNHLLFTNTHFYGALFEFCQGTLPHTIWEDGFASVSNYDYFKLFLVNGQAPYAPLSIENPEPTVVVSTFENLSYIAIYSFILDIEAKNFVRPIVLVFANMNPDIISNVNFLYLNKMINFIKEFTKSASNLFPNDLKDYANSLLKCIEQNPKRAQQLQKKMDQVKQLLDLYNVKDIDPKNGYNKPPEYFLLVHNDLRPLQKLTNLAYISAQLDHLLSNLPTTLLCSSIASHADVVESDPRFTFAGVDKFHGFSTLAFKLFSHNYEDDRYSIRSFVKTPPEGVFKYCAFTLLSGQPLIIVSENTDVAVSLANKFSVLVPFFRDEYLVVLKEATTSFCLKYAIVVLQNLIRDESCEYVSVLNLDKNFYQGEMCPQNSFVMTKLTKLVTVSERAFLISLYSELKRISTDFVMKLAMEANKTENNPDKLFKALKDVGLEKDDEPIFKYWLNCFFNKTRCKPILRFTGTKPTGKIIKFQEEKKSNLIHTK